MYVYMQTGRLVKQGCLARPVAQAWLSDWLAGWVAGWLLMCVLDCVVYEWWCQKCPVDGLPPYVIWLVLLHVCVILVLILVLVCVIICVLVCTDLYSCVLMCTGV